MLITATSALDAESETLVNQALGALLKGNNTTISIAHRLSTIKRSDTILVLSSDGTVAQQGSYEQLSQDPNGAFTQLMEWQMSGAETSEPRKGNSEASPDHQGDLEDRSDFAEAMAEAADSETEEDEQAMKNNDGLGPENVISKSEGIKR